MKLQKLPTGQQDFVNVRNSGSLYVDKTRFIHKLMEEDGSCFYFLSRPRRFGKSLLLNTIKEVFLGNKQHFQGLFIEDKIEWENFPVIHIDFSKISFEEIGLEQALKIQLTAIAKEYGLKLLKKGNGPKFEELIIKLHEKTGKQAVILIDEYDKPITEHLESQTGAEAHRDMLRSFYGIIKGNSAHIRFFFLTGISRFSKMSLFSTLNNLTDITFAEDYHNICGYTKEELEGCFAAHIDAVDDRRKLGGEKIREEIKSWYNGYSWNGRDRVYNPYSILRFLDAQEFGNYWFGSGTPRFLIKMLKPGFQYDLKNIMVNMASFDSYDISNLNIDTLLFQTGYLTVKEKDSLGDFLLDYPNKEVEQSMLQYLLMDYCSDARSSAIANNFTRAIHRHDPDLFIETVNTLFASIPYPIFLANREAYYHSILYIALKLCGFHITAEVHQSKGRLDALLRHENRLYFFEFKLDESADAAMAQIKARGYHHAYMGQGLEIYLVGINFSSVSKEVEGWKVESYE